MTHQGTLPITCPASNGAERLSRCSVCGRTSRWHDPFYPLPQRRFKSRHARPRADAQISTFSEHEADSIICAKGANLQSDFVVVGYDRAMPTAAHTSTEGLRLRRCLDPTCNTMFAICRCCDRGQRYCGDECRQRVRRLQLAAGRRYQATDAGQQAHCQRQRSYRERSSPASVTHQGPSSVTCPTAPATKDLNQCFICGRVSRWHNPFDSVTLRRFRRGRPWCRPGAQISTFLHDR